jgi:hypothetical protein
MNNLLIVTISLFLVSYQALMGNLFWPYAGALLTETGLSLASMVIWGCVLLMSICTQMMFNSFGVAGTFYFFSAFTFVGFFVLFFLMKETKGVPKDELPLLYLPKSLWAAHGFKNEKDDDNEQLIETKTQDLDDNFENEEINKT